MIEGKPYTVHLKQQLFIPSEFRVYTYDVQGSLLSDFAAVTADCYYQGYIEGVANSAVMLSTCSGLRGLLQFENVSYGIEPLDSSSGFEHLVYQIKNGSTERLLSENEYMFRDGEQVSGEVSHTLHIEYNYMGSDKYVVTRKIVQLIGFVNSMFSRLNVTIVLSSLEFWTDYNKIITTGEANELLHRFVKWKNSHLVLRPHDMAYLLVYRDHPRYVGTTFAGKMCVSNYSGAVALYQDVMTLESFSIVVAQLLGLSLGMTYDDSRTCQCSGPTCIMHRNAIVFLPSDFRVYTYSRQGGMHSEIPTIKRDCFYRGYVAGFPSSVATLSTCAGLRGVLQVENITYGIEPLDSAPGFQHLMYRTWNEDVESQLFVENDTLSGDGGVVLQPDTGRDDIYQRAVTLETFSVVVAQLLGLSLGMTLEDPRTCRCTGATCLMHPGAVGAHGPKAFSACSIRDLARFLATEDGRCLLNRPHMNVSYRAPVCGNKVVEPGEECDCGSSQECQRNRCCQPTCRFKSNIKCSTGVCCSNCQFLRNGTLCRSTVDGECDLQEYCNGSSAACPPDFWVMDGHPCKRQSGYCYKSKCQLANKQCTQVFGRGAKSAPLACYEEVNSKNDRMGNCGSQPTGYLSCPVSDFLCGKLVCELPLKKPFVKTTAAVIYARAKSHLCVTLDYMQDLGKTDPMAVSDGTVCGDKKICMNRKCVDVSVLGYNCDIETKCNNRGVCNNRGNCHCDSGWMPPDCTVKTKAGFGGSIDSNFRSSPIADRVHTTAVRNWLLLSCFLFLPVLVGSVFLVMKRKKLAQCCDKKELQADNLEDVDKPGDPSRA
uniref:ADAM metallopeptidase domain 32 n=1 Tax=Crocodylus porosus TaxID=8502 RepID=A0A7M4DXP9_CROPO